MRVEIEIWEIPEFSKDVAFYSVNDGVLDRLRRNLASNPYWGDPRSEEQRMRDWEFAGYCVTYIVSDDSSLITLLRIKPKEEARGELTKKALKLLKIFLELRDTFKS